MIDECARQINFAIASGKIDGPLASALYDPDVTAYSIGKEINENGGYDWKLECMTDKEINLSFRKGL